MDYNNQLIRQYGEELGNKLIESVTGNTRADKLVGNSVYIISRNYTITHKDCEDSEVIKGDAIMGVYSSYLKAKSAVVDTVIELLKKPNVCLKSYAEGIMYEIEEDSDVEHSIDTFSLHEFTIK